MNTQKNIEIAVVDAMWYMSKAICEASVNEKIALSKEMRAWYAIFDFKKTIIRKRRYRVSVRVSR